MTSAHIIYVLGFHLAWLYSVQVAAAPQAPVAQESVEQISNPPPDDTARWRLTTLADSEGISEVIAVNDAREAVGVRERLLSVGILKQEAYLFQQGRVRAIPVLPQYTRVDVQAISDHGHVVGYCTRPLQGEGTNPQAFVWNTRGDQPVPLPPAVDGTGCHAMDISADGSVVVGYTLGSDPPSMRPCVWRRQHDNRYDAEALSVITPHNPYLQTSRVAVDATGNLVVACIRVDPDRAERYHTCMWRRQDDGVWRRTTLLPAGLKLAGISSDGTVAANRRIGGSWRAVRLSPHDNLPQLLPIPSTHTASEARDINAVGTIVGFSEGPDEGPTSWRWSPGGTDRVSLPRATHWVVATSITARGDIGGYFAPVDARGDYERTVSFLLHQER